jgi:predicted RNA-binding Zn-ribbon protein involved in translation (DUF1610 family)
MKYKCDWCGEVITSHEWNKATDKGFNNYRHVTKIVPIEKADEECMYLCPRCGNVDYIDGIQEVE